jgi:bacteriophage HK97-gp10 putative tail-component
VFSLNIPLPGLDDASAKELKELLKGYEQASNKGPVRGGVVSEGDAAAYALVWEWGNARQTKEGPKTVLGINPDGEQVWLSIQAPFGYIRINEPEYVHIVMQELDRMDLSDTENADDILAEMQKASAVAGERIAELIRQVAPIDTGALRESIQAADPRDPDLAVDDEDVELGTTHFTHAIRQTLGKLKGK